MMMEFLLTIFGACLIGLGVGLMFYNKKSEAKKPWKPKKKPRSIWDDDPLYGTPLQKIK